MDSNDPFADTQTSSIQDPNGDAFKLRTGYDMATGLGSVKAGTLAQSLCAARAPVFTVAVANPGTVTATLAKPFALQISASDSGNVPVGYSAAGLPSGLAISPANGLISGTPSVVGTATVTVAAGDNDANSGSTTFALKIAAPVKKVVRLRPSKVALAGLIRRRPKLSFVIAGKTAVKAFSVSLPKGLKFSKRPRALKKGVSVKVGKKAPKFAVKVKKDTLAVTLKKAARKVTVTICRPALTITRGEARRIKRKKVRSLSLKITTTSAKKKTSTTKVTFKKLHLTPAGARCK